MYVDYYFYVEGCGCVHVDDWSQRYSVIIKRYVASVLGWKDCVKEEGEQRLELFSLFLKMSR